jgi:hypothetical protein
VIEEIDEFSPQTRGVKQNLMALRPTRNPSDGGLPPDVSRTGDYHNRQQRDREIEDHGRALRDRSRRQAPLLPRQ